MVHSFRRLPLLFLLAFVFLAACGGADSESQSSTAVPAAVPVAAKPQLIEFYANW